LGALAEAQDVLAARGVALETKTVRLIAYRDAARARLAPQRARPAFADTVAGRRVVISREGGRRRRREPQRGPKTQKGRLLPIGVLDIPDVIRSTRSS